jgi:hypothetical protein
MAFPIDPPVEPMLAKLSEAAKLAVFRGAVSAAR